MKDPDLNHQGQVDVARDPVLAFVVGEFVDEDASARFLCEPLVSRPSWRAVLRAAGVGQGGAPAAKRGRTTLTNPRAGAHWLWAG